MLCKSQTTQDFPYDATCIQDRGIEALLIYEKRIIAKRRKHKLMPMEFDKEFIRVLENGF